MRLVFAAQHLVPPVGGAETSTLTMLGEMEGDITCVQLGEEEGIRRENELEIHELYCPGYFRLKSLFGDRLFWLKTVTLNSEWESSMSNLLEERAPDAVMTQQTVTAGTVEAARRKGVPSTVFVHDILLLDPESFYLGDVEFSTVTGRWKDSAVAAYRKALGEADAVIANSRATADIIEDRCDTEAEVVYPFMELDGEGEKGNKITMVSPQRDKGGDIFLHLAERFPDQDFLAAGRTDIGDELKAAGNIEYVGRVDDMEKVYGETKILLMPSQVWESFGMTAAEAGSHGIPTVASRLGGLPEAVGEGGILIDDYGEIDVWESSLRRLLEDQEEYERVSEGAREHAKEMDFRNRGAPEKMSSVLGGIS